MGAPDSKSARERFDVAVRAEPEPSSPKTGKFRQLRDIVAGLVGVPPESVAPLWVNKAANIDNRCGQPGAKGKRVQVALCSTRARRADESVADYEAAFAKTLASYENRGRIVVGGNLTNALLICAMKNGEPWTPLVLVERPKGEFAARLTALFPELRVVHPTLEVPDEQEANSVSIIPPADTADLADALYVPDEWLTEVLWLLRDKRGLVLYGPPGTGKTYLGRKLAEHVQPDASRRRLVQLHTSYGYEDFFEGYRPATMNGKATLTLQKGPLRELADLANETPNQPVVLVLDEMNRANLSRVFGELFLLLEYREESVRLMYSPGEEFTFPRNLFVIGTMNSADRSIALIDQALRRRFHFAALFPGEYPVKEMLRHYLADNKPEMSWIADLLDLVNSRLEDRHCAIGPSHFMRADLDDNTLGRIWRASILPTLEEHFYAQPGRLKEFELPRLVAEVRGEQPSA